MSAAVAPSLDGPTAPALFRVVKGRPTPEELAAVTAVLTTLSVSRAGGPGQVPDGESPAGWDRLDARSFPPTSWRVRRP
ncbi:acyl-CoA carboxylase subunit epsilon [Streptomyces sp. H39-S7]|uniref:acyl-CoA carboxylase subunit epsilon n=1 Tax=Streptomyces sp. H39-S7 TaxID=3004357 RepID=UPI0022AEC30D|nr:acyl-CoA carboxylase subunit epsilon [Streptomyces sp. H39-S7]MCZ4123384.1 acyl-CoA carboxylase subunit epsilon [Streptomyces sp. H39-S7]